jgi:hypothetical protein
VPPKAAALHACRVTIKATAALADGAVGKAREMHDCEVRPPKMLFPRDEARIPRLTDPEGNVLVAEIALPTKDGLMRHLHVSLHSHGPRLVVASEVRIP